MLKRTMRFVIFLIFTVVIFTFSSCSSQKTNDEIHLSGLLTEINDDMYYLFHFAVQNSSNTWYRGESGDYFDNTVLNDTHLETVTTDEYTLSCDGTGQYYISFKNDVPYEERNNFDNTSSSKGDQYLRQCRFDWENIKSLADLRQKFINCDFTKEEIEQMKKNAPRDIKGNIPIFFPTRNTELVLPDGFEFVSSSFTTTCFKLLFGRSGDDGKTEYLDFRYTCNNNFQPLESYLLKGENITDYDERIQITDKNAYIYTNDSSEKVKAKTEYGMYIKSDNYTRKIRVIDFYKDSNLKKLLLKSAEISTEYLEKNGSYEARFFCEVLITNCYMSDDEIASIYERITE